MIRDPQRLAELEARHQRETYGNMSFRQALARFVALWREAQLLRGDLGTDWQADLDPDLAIARAVNGLPPDA